MLATTTDLAGLLDSIEHLWSLPSTFASTQAHEGYRRVGIVRAGHVQHAQFAALLAPLEPVYDAWLSAIAPGGFIVEHIDGGPHRERWQIPFTTAGRLLHDGQPVDHEVGVPFRVHHDDWHSVTNFDDVDRVSLVVDRDVIVSATSTPFRKAVC